MRLFFPNALRLSDSDRIRRLLKTRSELRSAFFIVHRLPNGGPKARLGLVVPKRLARTSVARNRVKRFAKEAFRQCQWQLAGSDIVIRLNKSVSAVDMKALSVELREVMRNIAE